MNYFVKECPISFDVNTVHNKLHFIWLNWPFLLSFSNYRVHYRIHYEIVLIFPYVEALLSIISIFIAYANLWAC